MLVNYEYPGVTENCGGGGRVTQLLRRGLRSREHDPVLVTDASDGHWATFPVRSVPRARAAIQRDDPDVIHGHFSIPSSPALPFADGDRPLVVSVMGADVFDPTRFDALRPITDKVNDWLFARADAVVAPSTDMAERVTEKHAIEPELIPYGIDPDAWDWHARSLHDPVRVLTVARLVERKNIDVAVRALNHVAAGGQPVEYRVIGTGPTKDDLQAIDTDADVEFRGYVPELKSEYDWADLFLLPSAHEAFGMVFLEALASGLPVVTSDTGGQTDIVSDAVGETVPSRPGEVGAAVASVIDNYETRQAATEGYVAEHFHVDTMVDQYLDLYRSVA
jgi:glycosyltransferase involved in cell wall biosynthesis